MAQNTVEGVTLAPTSDPSDMTLSSPDGNRTLSMKPRTGTDAYATREKTSRDNPHSFVVQKGWSK